MLDYYEILGVPRTATSGEVRQAYLRLARERHPDRFPDPGEKSKAQEFFKDLTTAFNTLSNDRTRSQYDAELAKPRLTSPEEIAKDAYARGVKSLESRDYPSAVELLRTAVHYASGEARYHAALGRALAGDPRGAREAIQAVEKAVQLAPEDGTFHALLAGMLHSQGLKIRARKALETALRLAPQDPEVQRVASELGSSS